MLYNQFMPELSRFFGIIIRMYLEVGAPIIFLIFMPIIKTKWQSMALTLLNWYQVHCPDANKDLLKHGQNCTRRNYCLIGTGYRPGKNLYQMRL